MTTPNLATIIASALSAPRYVDPSQRGEAGHINDRLLLGAHTLAQRKLDQVLDLDGFEAAYHLLHDLQRDVDFVPSWEKSLRWYRIADIGRGGNCRHLLGSANAKRGERGAGAGRPTVPRGARVQGEHEGCFLCLWQVRFQQRGIQIPWIVGAGPRAWVVLVSPYPFGRAHATIASLDPIGQDWNGDRHRFEEIARAMAHFARGLGPTMMVGWNGIGAAASISMHAHLHTLRIPLGEPLPVRQAFVADTDTGPGAADADADAMVAVTDPRVYPLAVVRIAGDVENVVAGVVECARKWHARGGPTATENVVMVEEDANAVDRDDVGGGDGGRGNDGNAHAVGKRTLVAYYFPRDATRPGCHALESEFGFMESAGAFVAGTPHDVAIFRTLTYRKLLALLGEVRPPGLLRW